MVKHLINLDIKNHNNLEEYIIFGFPDISDKTKVLHHSIMSAKYNMYKQQLKGNDNIDMYAYLAFLKTTKYRKNKYA